MLQGDQAVTSTGSFETVHDDLVTLLHSLLFAHRLDFCLALHDHQVVGVGGEEFFPVHMHCPGETAFPRHEVRAIGRGSLAQPLVIISHIEKHSRLVLDSLFHLSLAGPHAAVPLHLEVASRGSHVSSVHRETQVRPGVHPAVQHLHLLVTQGLEQEVASRRRAETGVHGVLIGDHLVSAVDASPLEGILKDRLHDLEALSIRSSQIGEDLIHVDRPLDVRGGVLVRVSAVDELGVAHAVQTGGLAGS